jgi:hypothetical protein
MYTLGRGSGANADTDGDLPALASTPLRVRIVPTLGRKKTSERGLGQRRPGSAP